MGSLIWLNLIIPIIAILFLILVFNKKIVWWEYLLIITIPVLGVFIAKAISISNQTRDIEYWNFKLTNAIYTESYETYNHKTCTRCVERDTSGTCVKEEDYDCSTCDNYPPHWTATKNDGKSISISQQQYKELVKLWQNEKKVELNRHINYHFGCGKDGDAYTTIIKNDSIQYIYPYIEKHVYENRVQASNNVFNFQDIDTVTRRQYKLYDYPQFNEFYYNPVLGYSDNSVSTRLQQWNAKLGMLKKCHLLLCVYRNSSTDAATKQEAYWKRGNKNEIVLCIGIDNENNITWSYIFSWTENELLKIQIRDAVSSMGKLDLIKVIDTYGELVLHSEGFVKRSFKEFSYISVEPSFTTVIITFIITILLTSGLCIFSIVNDFKNE